MKLDYTYNTSSNHDNNGNILSQKITVPTVGQSTGFVATQTYSYDSLNRISQAAETIPSQTGWQQTFVYDRYGNRRFDTANTDTLAPGCLEAVCNPQVDPATNKLVGYVFDYSGNTTTDATGQTFIYDAENKQVQVNDSNGVVGKYFYDGDGKRIKKVVPDTGETTIFVYDAGGKTIAEYSTIVALPTEAKVSYLTNDHLGSPRITTDELGQVISRRDFHPFGEEIYRPNYNTDSVRQKFTGYERDTETDLDFAQARYYANKLGRFTTTDPLFFQDDRLIIPQRFNLFVYASNNPMKYTDSTGLDVEIIGEGASNRVDDINNREGKNTFKVKLNTSNLLEIIDQEKVDYSKLSNREKSLYDAITNTDTRATLKGVKSDERFDFGGFSTQVGETVGTNLLDNGDLSLLRKKSKVAAGEIVSHEIIEAFSSAGDTNDDTKGDYLTHHTIANKSFSGTAISNGPVKLIPVSGQRNKSKEDLLISTIVQPLELKTPTNTIKWSQTVVMKGGPYKVKDVKAVYKNGIKGNITKIK